MYRFRLIVLFAELLTSFGNMGRRGRTRKEPIGVVSGLGHSPLWPLSQADNTTHIIYCRRLNQALTFSCHGTLFDPHGDCEPVACSRTCRDGRQIPTMESPLVLASLLVGPSLHRICRRLSHPVSQRPRATHPPPTHPQPVAPMTLVMSEAERNGDRAKWRMAYRRRLPVDL